MPKGLSLIFIALTLFSMCISLLAQSPPLLNYQGKLTDQNGQPLSGSHIVSFRIYADSSAQTWEWKEDRDIIFNDGVFAVLLGSREPFPETLFEDHSALYLGIKVNNDAEMTPRFLITSVPFALHAKSANTLHGGIRIETGEILVTTDEDYVVEFEKPFMNPPVVTFGASRDADRRESFATFGMPEEDARPSTHGFRVRLVEDTGNWSRGIIYWIAVGQ